MKIQTLIVAGAAAFALLAPAAGAAGNKSSRHVGTAGHVTAHRVVKHKSGTGSKTSKPAPLRTVPYIYIPGPSNPAPPYVDPNECQDNGTNCTDVQACDYWGENCGSLPSFALPDPATTIDTTTGTVATAG